MNCRIHSQLLVEVVRINLPSCSPPELEAPGCTQWKEETQISRGLNILYSVGSPGRSILSVYKLEIFSS